MNYTIAHAFITAKERLKCLLYPLCVYTITTKTLKCGQPKSPGELLIGMQVCFGFQTTFRFKYYFSPFPKKIKLPMMLLHVSCVSVPLK